MEAGQSREPAEGDGMNAVRRIKHKSKGYAGLINDPKAQQVVDDHGERWAEAIGDPSFIYVSRAPTHTRASGAVIALRGDPENKIIRNMDAGR